MDERMIERRLAAIETVLVDLLRENAHILVGGEAFAKDSILTLREARTVTQPAAPTGGQAS